MKVRKNGTTFTITGITDSVVATRFLRSCGFTVVDDLLARATEQRNEAVTGGQPCPSCDGTGTSYPHGPEPEMCERCDGTGQV